MHTIRFDAQTERALSREAALAGKDIEQIIREAVADYLEEQDDIRAYDNAKAEGGDPVPFDVALAEIEQH